MIKFAANAWYRPSSTLGPAQARFFYTFALARRPRRPPPPFVYTCAWAGQPWAAPRVLHLRLARATPSFFDTFAWAGRPGRPPPSFVLQLCFGRRRLVSPTRWAPCFERHPSLPPRVMWPSATRLTWMRRCADLDKAAFTTLSKQAHVLERRCRARVCALPALASAQLRFRTSGVARP